MNNVTGYVLATAGVVSLVAFLTLDTVRARSDAPTVTASTAHFKPNGTYLFNPVNGAGQIRCRVLEVDGAWLRCEGENFEWVNTDVMMYARDTR